VIRILDWLAPYKALDSEPEDTTLNNPECTEKQANAASVAAMLCIWQLLLHLLACVRDGDPRLVLPHLVAWLHYVLLFSLIAGSLSVSGRLLSEKLKTVTVIGTLLLVMTGMVLALYPQMLLEYLSYPVNLFTADSSSIRATLVDYLGIQKLWPAFATMVLMISARNLAIRKPPRRAALWLFFPVVLAGLATVPRTPHSVVFSLVQSFGDSGSGVRVVPVRQVR
jgi:hypothetical protein